MAYTPLTEDQFNKAVSDGFTPQQIIQNEKVRQIRSNPEYQGGANAPALVKARGDVSKLQGENQNLDAQVGAMKGARLISRTPGWPV